MSGIVFARAEISAAFGHWSIGALGRWNNITIISEEEIV